MTSDSATEAIRKHREGVLRRYEQKAACRVCGNVFSPVAADPALRGQLLAGMLAKDIAQCPACGVRNQIGFLMFGGALVYRRPM